eukprot:3418955-Pyramimonas_sp.AAC.1
MNIDALKRIAPTVSCKSGVGASKEVACQPEHKTPVKAGMMATLGLLFSFGMSAGLPVPPNIRWCLNTLQI